MKGFFSPIERLLGQSTRGKGTGAEFMTELSKQPGYKQAEVEDRDLQTLMALPKMAREEFMAQLKAKPGVVPQEEVRGTKLTGSQRLAQAQRAADEEYGRPYGELDHDEQQSIDRYIEDDQTSHKDYTLPGGENYREILLQHPKGDFPGVGAHFGGTPNILASIRVKDRTGPNGEKILHLEEIQSDWHQMGREKGYVTKENNAQLAAAYKHAKDAEFQHKQLKSDLDKSKEWSDTLSKRLESGHPDFAVGMPRRAETVNSLQVHNENIMDLMPQVMKADEIHRRAREERERLIKESYDKVSDAPFKKNWHELALKRMIQHAAENGYDSIAITPGEEQAKRYGLSKHVGMVSYNPDEQHFQAFKPNRETLINEKGASPERVSELIGKDAATRLMSAPAQMGHHFLEGEDLNVGGEGMKGFYDKMVPKFLNQFGKKYGAQVQSGAVPIVSTPAQHHGLTESQFQAQPPEEQQRMMRQHAYAHEGAKTTVPVHSFPITPEMRQDVLKNGIPMYAKGGEVEVRPTVKDETIQRKVPEMEMAAKALQAGIIDRKEYDRIINKHKPVKPYTFVPQPATDEDAERALMVNKKPQWRGAERWPAGRKVGLRLDIPAYESHGVWVNSIHDEEGSGEDKYKTSYGPVSSVKNATFDAGPSKGIKVATGEQNKSPFARIVGELHHINEDEAVEHMKEHLNHPDWAQVGMDPRRHGFFYDRKTMKPVTHSAHVIQIGPLVLAHKPTYGKRESYAEGGAVDNKAKFLEGSHTQQRMYHGTGKVFKQFAPNTRGVHFVTPDPKFAEKYAGGEYSIDVGESPNIMPVYVSAKNPFDYENKKHRDALAVKASIGKLGMDEIKKGKWSRIEDRTTLKAIKDLGHDSVYVNENGIKNLGVFNPAQIKSAIGNRGTYDTTKDDLSMAKGGAVSHETIKPIAHGIIKERVTVSPNMDAMQYELLSAKHFTKKVK